MLADPWGGFRQLGKTVLYPSGIRWECHHCAMCCTDTENHARRIRLLRTECETISTLTNIEEDGFSQRADSSSLYSCEILKKNGRCIFLKDKRCTIYEIRPLTCIFYPFFLNRIGSSHLQFMTTPEGCSGLGNGQIIMKDHYERLLKLATKRIRESNRRETPPQSF